ncbi:DUF2059 domain-containing protein [Pseudomonas argentinensis]|uniref:DUF2059 domain-containing protein n=1 Tax=Phytopseudomonas argentinensis TaxID=289370 RepID=UPI00094529D2|nr:DUF2059 domain-containing protein [Pseudomonas argentinensis]KAB0548615.1 DUF2059 domain-containing protein [Pseudomonas argentinensis]
MRYLIAAISIFIASHAFADSKTQKIEALLRAQGLVDTWAQQLKSSREYNNVMAQQIMGKVTANLTPNEEFRKRFNDAGEKFLNNVVTPWTAEDMVAVWGDYYGPEFTESELDQLIAFYSSPLAQKEIQVGRSALEKFTLHFQNANKPIVDKATNQYLQDLQLIAKECNCTK